MPRAESGYDKYIYDNLQCVIPFFCKNNIHPNVITIFGIFLNYIVYIILKEKPINTLIISFILILRYIVDCLDGEVARHCNKKSKLGGFLDLHSDLILISIMLCYILNVFNIIIYNQINIIVMYIFILLFFEFLKENYNYSFSEHTCDSKFFKMLDTNMIIVIFIVLIFIHITK